MDQSVQASERARLLGFKLEFESVRQIAGEEEAEEHGVTTKRVLFAKGTSRAGKRATWLTLQQSKIEFGHELK